MVERSAGAAADDGKGASKGPVPLAGVAADGRSDAAHMSARPKNEYSEAYLLQSRDHGRSGRGPCCHPASAHRRLQGVSL
jgi:hypothetical protein